MSATDPPRLVSGISMSVADWREFIHAKAERAEVVAENARLTREVERLTAECCKCEKCGHVQAEPNWCHECRHRVSMPEWAATLLKERMDALEAVEDLTAERDEALREATEASE